MAELVRFNNQLNEQNYNNRFNALFSLAKLGSNAATNQATVGSDLITQGGNARAAGITGLATHLGDQSFLNAIFKRDG